MEIKKGKELLGYRVIMRIRALTDKWCSKAVRMMQESLALPE
jgi:hypothetical protein